MDDLRLNADGIPRFYSHPTYVHSDPTTGITFRAEEGDWRSVATTTRSHAPYGGPGGAQLFYMEGELFTLSVFAPLLATGSDGGINSVGSGQSNGGGAHDAGVTATTEIDIETSSDNDDGAAGAHTRGVPPGVVWVDFDYLGPEDGSETQPFNLLAEGVAAVLAGGSINLKAASSEETITVSKAMTITAVGGTVRVGDALAVRDVTINRVCADESGRPPRRGSFRAGLDRVVQRRPGPGLPERLGSLERQRTAVYMDVP